MSKQKRGAIKRLFTITYNELQDELLKTNDADVEIIRRIFRRLEDRFSQLDKADEIVMGEMVMNDVPQSEMDDEIEARQEYRDKMNDITMTVEEIYKKPEEDGRSMGDNNQSMSCCGNSKTNYKLPKLELVKFDGEPKNWLQFWSQFKSIHEDNNLTSEIKFQYLLQATVVDSPARNVVSSFPPTSENYPKAIDYLKTRFGGTKF